MSFDSGKKLGLTASILYLTVPIITVALYVIFIFSLFSSVTTLTSRSTTTPLFSPFAFSFGILWAVIIVLGLLGLVSLILFIIAMYQLSHYYNEPGIFKNVIYSLIVSIVGGVALIITMIAVIFLSLTSSIGRTSSAAPTFGVFIIAFIAIVVVALVVGIVSALLNKRAFNLLGAKSGVRSFDTAGLLLLIGVIIPIVSWIGWIFAAIGFNQLKPKPIENQTIYSTAPPSPTQVKFCHNCGASNNITSIYCKNCGQPLQ